MATGSGIRIVSCPDNHGSHLSSLVMPGAHFSNRGRRAQRSSPSRNKALTVPVESTRRIGNASKRGNCMANKRATTFASTATCPSCIFIRSPGVGAGRQYQAPGHLATRPTWIDESGRPSQDVGQRVHGADDHAATSDRWISVCGDRSVPRRLTCRGAAPICAERKRGSETASWGTDPAASHRLVKGREPPR